MRDGHLITPNMTEACLVLGRPFQGDRVTPASAREMLEALCALGPQMAVLTGICTADNTIGAATLDQTAFSLSMKRSAFPATGMGRATSLPPPCLARCYAETRWQTVSASPPTLHMMRLCVPMPWELTSASAWILNVALASCGATPGWTDGKWFPGKCRGFFFPRSDPFRRLTHIRSGAHRSFAFFIFPSAVLYKKSTAGLPSFGSLPRYDTFLLLCVDVDCLGFTFGLQNQLPMIKPLAARK